jgi:arsenate reductase (glutaredoxin)
MNKIYYLSTCDTCARIIDELGLRKRRDFEFQDIKTEKITKDQLDEMKAKSGSYESLFSRIALKYKNLDPKPAKESEYKKLILQEYTFLKRPVIHYDGQIFIGNSKTVIAAAKEALHKSR